MAMARAAAARRAGSVIMRTIATAEMRDPTETGAHVQRVSECSVAIYDQWAARHGIDAGEQSLVFTQFRQMGVLLQQHLHERFGQRTPFLHGGVTKQGRDRMVAEFQSGMAPSPLLLVSLKAGGVGLNLTAASQVVHYDRWWNPAVEDQATDRAWRIGQERTVFVHKLVCEGTVEERIDALINDKRGLAQAVVGSTGEEWLSELSTDDLRDLVRLDLSKARGA
jgi:SNF2 family DNA or RNA helicase